MLVTAAQRLRTVLIEKRPTVEVIAKYGLADAVPRTIDVRSQVEVFPEGCLSFRGHGSFELPGRHVADWRPLNSMNIAAVIALPAPSAIAVARLSTPTLNEPDANPTDWTT